MVRHRWHAPLSSASRSLPSRLLGAGTTLLILASLPPLATTRSEGADACSGGPAGEVSSCESLAASSTLEALTESELEWEEEAEAAWSEVSLLQASIQVQRSAGGGGDEGVPQRPSTTRAGRRWPRSSRSGSAAGGPIWTVAATAAIASKRFLC